MKCTVIGYGSIGSRHYRILGELGCTVSVVSKRDIPVDRKFRTIEEALDAENPEYIIISNKTSDHYSALETLINLGYKGTVLVEKPIFDSYKTLDISQFNACFVAYNLRFHPLLQKLFQVLSSENRICSFQVQTGQYLPYWRPDTDYRHCYSSKKSEGGGVLRDLSHELDYVNWLMGGWKRLTALGGKFSSLEIDSDDVYIILMKTIRCPAVSIQINYLDRAVHRDILIITDNNTIEVDLINGKFIFNGTLEEIQVDRDYTYREMHRRILINNYKDICTYQEGLEVVKIIEGAEKAVEQIGWVERC